MDFNFDGTCFNKTISANAKPNMIKTKISYLNKKIIVEEEQPSTIKELVTLIGEEGVVSNTIANIYYRNKYPRVYKRVSDELTRRGFPPVEVEGKMQDEMQQLRAFYVSKPAHAAMLQEMFETAAREEPLFIKGDRSGGGKVSQGALDAAHRYIAEGPDKVSDAVTTIEDMLPGFRVSREPNGEVAPESLAKGIQTLQRHLISKSKAVVQNL